MHRITLLSAALLAALASACRGPAESSVSVRPAAARAEVPSPAAERIYGVSQQLGNGTVRTYIQLDDDGRTPIEVGVAMTESSMDGLPAPMAMTPGNSMAAHAHQNVFLLELPAKNPTPYKFVQFDWNPAGHEPAGVYTFPHFDFHFYTVSKGVRASMLPNDPRYAEKAASFPAPAYRPPFYIDAATAAGAPPAAVTVPQMGLHWLDVRSPELQKLTGHPEAYHDFTKTFIYGSWDGQFIFDEPMITRAYIMSKHDATDPAVRDELVPISTAQRYAPAGYYPGAYRITWDASAKEYRVALTQLAWKE